MQLDPATSLTLCHGSQYPTRREEPQKNLTIYATTGGGMPNRLIIQATPRRHSRLEIER